MSLSLSDGLAVGGRLIAGFIYAVVVFHALDERSQCSSCPHTPLPLNAPLTPEQALLTDQIGNEVYASHYAERKAYRLVIGCGTVSAARFDVV